MKNDVLVAIDGMYVIYYAIYRTLRIWQTKNKTEAEYYLTPATYSTEQHDLLKSDSFKSGLNMSIIHICTRINDIITEAFPKYAGLEPATFATQLFMLDDKISYNFRRQLYPDYKLTRAIHHAKQAFNINTVRNYVLDYLLDELDIWNRLGYRRVFVENAEADDVIFATMTEFSDQYTDKLIVASDHDLLQIPDVVQYNLEGKLLTRRTKKTNELMSCTDFLLRKIIMGDAGDNIPAITKRCGFVKAEKLVADKEKLKQLLTEDSTAAKQFALNKSLIDISKMPKDLATAIKNTILDVLKEDTVMNNSFEEFDFNLLSVPI